MFTWSDGTLSTDERYDGRTSIVELDTSSGGVAATVAVNVSSLRESDTGDYECRITYGRLLQSTSSSPPPLSSLPLPQSTTVTVVDDFKTDIDGGVLLRLDVQGESCNISTHVKYARRIRINSNW